MSRIALAVLALLTVSASSAALAQDRWQFDVRGGAAFATEDIGATDLGTGFGFEATVGYRLQPHLSLYAGWDWHRFPSDNSLAGADTDFEETGYAFGLLFEHPLGQSEAVALQVRAGGTYNHIEVENSVGDLIADSGHGLGYEGGMGLAVRRADRWRLTPGFRFRSVTRDLESSGGVTGSTDLRYLAVEVGFSRQF